jgi:hypothetical protein
MHRKSDGSFLRSPGRFQRCERVRGVARNTRLQHSLEKPLAGTVGVIVVYRKAAFPKASNEARGLGLARQVFACLAQL